MDWRHRFAASGATTDQEAAPIMPTRTRQLVRSAPTPERPPGTLDPASARRHLAAAGKPGRHTLAAVVPLLLAAALLAGCGGEPAATLTPPTSASRQAQPAAATSAPVFSAEAKWDDPKGNRFTILVNVSRPSNAGLSMCSMGSQFIGPSLLLSVRNDSKAKGIKGPQISVNDGLIAFPHGRTGCSYVFAPTESETFDPGDGHTYRSMVMTTQDRRFADVVLSVTVPGKRKVKGKLPTRELLRIPALKLYEAYRQGPVPTAPTQTQPGHHG
jgi:hypothetical protein